MTYLIYIEEYKPKFSKYAILAWVDRPPKYINKYILKITGPRLRLWNEFLTSELKNSHFIGATIEFVKNWLERECKGIWEKKPNKETRHKLITLQYITNRRKLRYKMKYNKFVRRK